MEFVLQQRPISVEDGWLDTVWAEGGAVIDPGNRTFVLYGGEDLLFDVPLRRVFLRMLRSAWEGWTIHWAHAGIISIAEYVGVSRDKVTAPPTKSPQTPVDLKPPQKPDYLSCVCTIQSKDDVCIYPLERLTSSYLFAGPSLLDTAASIPFHSALDVGEWTKDFPTGGIHIDVTLRQMHFWTADDCPSVPEIANYWRGWQVNWHKDQFEVHERLTGSALKYSIRPQSDLLGTLLLMLDKDSKPVDVLELAQRFSEREGGKKVEVSPWATRDDRLPVEANVRKSILARCVSSLNNPVILPNSETK